MNELGVALLAGAARCLVLAVLGATLCAACRRRGPATVALALQGTLTALVVLVALAPLSWPRWRNCPASVVTRAGSAATVPGPARQGVILPLPAVASRPAAEAKVDEIAVASWVSAVVDSLTNAPRQQAEAEGWRWPAWVAAVYLAGAAVLLSRLAIGVIGVRAVRRRARRSMIVTCTH